MVLQDRFVDAGGVRLHAIASEPADAAGVPVLFLPGLADTAEEYGAFIEALAPHPAWAVSLRGRGRSDAPDDGYTMASQGRDVAAVAEATGWERLVLVTYSRGTTYGLVWACANPQRLAGLVVADYPAQQTGIPPGFAEAVAERTWRGRPWTDRVSLETLAAFQRDSDETVPLWDRLAALRCPVLTIGGGRDSSLLRGDAVERYEQALADHRHVELPASGHDLWAPDPAPLLGAVRGFLAEVDQREAVEA